MLFIMLRSLVHSLQTFPIDTRKAAQLSITRKEHMSVFLPQHDAGGAPAPLQMSGSFMAEKNRFIVLLACVDQADQQVAPQIT